MKLRSLITRPLRWSIAKAGYDLVWSESFGHDPFRDVQQLSSRWNSSIRIFFDVGANDGSTSLRAVNEFPDAQIFSFEPHAETFQRLTNVAKQYPAIHPIQTALG